MTDFNLDWDQALAAEEGMGGDFDPIPAGPYTVRAEVVEPKTFSTGSPGLKVRLVVEGGPHANRVLWTNLVWKADNPQSLGMFSKKVMAFGISREWLAASKPSLQAIANEMAGRVCQATVTIKEYQGKQTNDVGTLKPASTTPGISAPPVVSPGVPAAPPLPPVVAAPAPAATPPVVPIPVVSADDEEPF